MIASSVGAPTTVWLELNFTKLSTVGADLSVAIGGFAVTPTCGAGTCTFDGAPGALPANAAIATDATVTLKRRTARRTPGHLPFRAA